MKKTKKSLLFSGLALMMSALLLAGTTFAWFTDSVTNKGNTIQSGELQMDVYWFKWDVNEGKFVQTTMDNAKMSAENWEPGQSNAILMRLDNVGSLTSQVKLSFDVTEDTGLTDALWFNVIEGENYAEMTTTQPEHTKAPVYSTDTTVTCMSELESWEDPYQAKFTSVWPTDGKETEWRHWYLIEYGMYADAGNEYMNKTMTADIHLDVKQYTYEEDGFGNPNYDEDAFVADFEVKDTAELENALSQAKAGDTIALTNDIALDKPLTIKQDVTIDGMGSTISGQPITATADVTFKNVTLSKPTNTNKNATLVYGYTGCETLTFEGCTFADPQWEAMQITSADFKKLVVNNCTFTAANVEGAESSYDNAADEAIRYIHIQPKASDKVVADITITNNTFKNCDKIKDSIVGIYYVDSSTITVGGNTFENLTDEDTSAKLSVGWPEEEELKTVSNWTGEPKTFTIG